MPTNESLKQPKRGGSVDLPDNLALARGSREECEPFWKRKSLAEMSADEWESLCDGCGRCCLLKLEDEDTGEIAVTKLACKLLDIGSCRCSDYANRQRHVSDCVKLTPADVGEISWLPETCAYRLIDEGEELLWWHPLLSGTKETVFEAGISIRGFAISEKKIPVHRYPRHIVGWIEPKRR